ncbi:MAG: phosphate/phosphite/phosphonate ABC transporter substrate-binding protein [Chthoniobacterales bacterium]
MRSPRFLLYLILSVLLFCPPVHAAESPVSLDKVIVALKPDKDPDRMLAERAALSDLLSKEFGKPVEVIVPTSAAVITEGLKNGTIDIAHVSATEMVIIRDAGAGDLLLVGERDGLASYKSYWVSLADKPYASVEDLRGKPIAFSSRTSTSGYLIPMVDLRDRGLITGADAEEFFGKGNVVFGSGYVSAVERVLRGEVEAAAVSYYVLDEGNYLTDEQRAKLKKVTEQGPVPTHVIAVSSKLSEADRAVLKAGLIDLKKSATETSNAVFSADLIEVDADTHLAPVEKALTLLGQRK